MIIVLQSGIHHGFDTYSGETLEHLKTVQDNWECFGNTIGPNVVIRGYLDTPSTPEIDYWEDEGGKHFMVTFTTRDLGALVENTDIKPFKDAVVASGFNLDADNSTSDDYLYDKDNVRINIYIVDMTDYDPHFEFVVDEP